MKVAVFGLGIIGSLFARHYEADGVLVAAWNRTAKPSAPHFQADAPAAAREASVLHLVVADPTAVATVLEAILPVLSRDSLVIQSSTIDPRSSQRFAALVAAKNARYVEAPFTGSKPAAETRQTIFYLGGEDSAVQDAETLLGRISARIFRCGKAPDAAALKLAMNLQIAVVMQALIEGLTFARRAGIKDDLFFQALEHNASRSGLVGLKEAKLRAADYSPQFSVKHLLKDVRLALGTAGSKHLPAATLLADLLGQAEAQGFGDEDFSAIAKLLDR
jgi:3-hydroxyisobutyrate dehydrogenase-like beta-hydroxyacid dehydrogenase